MQQYQTMSKQSSTAINVARFGVQCILIPWELFLTVTDRISHFVLRRFFKPEFRRAGACQQTGACCQAIGMEFPRFMEKRPKRLKFFIRWHFLRYNFQFLGLSHNMLVYECLYLTKDKKCGIHWRKPKLCRDYPFPMFYGYPKLHKGCGYSFVPVKISPFEKALKQAGCHEDKPPVIHAEKFDV